MSKIWTISCDNSLWLNSEFGAAYKFGTQLNSTPKRYEIGRQLLLITNRKSHTGLRLVSTSMTLNDLKRRNSPHFAFFSPNSIALQADYVTVVKHIPIMSVKYCLPVLVFHFWPKLTHPSVRSLCDSSAEHLVLIKIEKSWLWQKVTWFRQRALCSYSCPSFTHTVKLSFQKISLIFTVAHNVETKHHATFVNGSVVREQQ